MYLLFAIFLASRPSTALWNFRKDLGHNSLHPHHTQPQHEHCHHPQLQHDHPHHPQCQHHHHDHHRPDHLNDEL